MKVGSVDTSPAVIRSRLNVAVVQRPPFNTVTSTIIYGEKDAVLFGGGLYLSDGHRLAGQLFELKRRPTFACVTHADGEQFFGLSVVRAAFPDLIVVALPWVAKTIANGGANMLRSWQKTMGGPGNLPETLIEVRAIGTDSGATLTLEGHDIQILGDQEGASGRSSSIQVPSLNQVVTHDCVCSSVQPATLESTPDSRRAWQVRMANIRALTADLAGQGQGDLHMPRSAADIDYIENCLLSYEAELIEASFTDPQSPRMRGHWPSRMSDLELQQAADHDFFKRQRSRK